MSRRGIVLAGIAVLDIVHVVDHWPAEETLSFILRTEHAAGGPPHNASAGLVKLGAPFPVTFISAVGDDEYGRLLIESARGYGVDTSQIRIVPGAVTSHTHVMSSADTGRRTFFAQLGINCQLRAEQLMPENSNAKLFYIGSPGVAPGLDESDGWLTLLKDARERGMQTCIELCPVPAGLLQRHVVPCLPLCDHLVVNDYEAASITGIATVRDGRFDWIAAERACRVLIDGGVRGIAAIHHPEGAIAMRASGETVRRGSVRVPRDEIAGTTGAGDAFFAGMLFGIHEEWELDQCVELANAAAATSLHAPTTSASIRQWEQCLAYAALHGHHETG